MSKIGRNEKCPCGSGKKYKKCHLDTASFYPSTTKLKKEDKSEVRDNFRFNRIKGKKDNHYLNNFGDKGLSDFEFKGLVKIKLVHSEIGSVIIPEIIFLPESERNIKWIQPFGFLPNVLTKFSEEETICVMYVDICAGHTLRLYILNQDHLRTYKDGSELFECIIFGPQELLSLATGNAYFESDKSILLELFHHTSADAKESILASRSFRLSNWNIQGTKKLENVGYVYFTSLPTIHKEGDLRQIAMSREGKIELLKDGFTMPTVVFGSSPSAAFPNDILELKVYREKTENRRSTVTVKAPIEFLASQHLHFHRPQVGVSYYNVCCPFIHRIGITPGFMLFFDQNGTIFESGSEVKFFTHIVMGDCTVLDGLAAPFHEETTSHICKVEFAEENSTIFDFWFKHPNQDHFTNKNIETYKFK